MMTEGRESLQQQGSTLADEGVYDRTVALARTVDILASLNIDQAAATRVIESLRPQIDTASGRKLAKHLGKLASMLAIPEAENVSIDSIDTPGPSIVILEEVSSETESVTVTETSITHSTRTVRRREGPVTAERTRTVRVEQTQSWSDATPYVGPESDGPDRPADTVDAWQDDALCTQIDPEIFFPDKGFSTSLAKRVCRTCDVRQECLDYSMKHVIEIGVWGGLSPQERRKLRKSA